MENSCIETAIKQLKSSDNLLDGWERSETLDNIYYVNHPLKKTQWNHPFYDKILSELGKYNDVKYSLYRIALKLKHLHDILKFDLIGVSAISRSFSDATITGTTTTCKHLYRILIDLYSRSHLIGYDADTLAELAFNLLLNIHDPLREGNIDINLVHVTLVILSNSPPIVKFQYVFRLMSLNVNLRQITYHQMIKLLNTLHKTTEIIDECSRSQSNQECIAQIKGNNNEEDLIDEFDFLKWCGANHSPSFAWMSIIQRFNVAKSVIHQSRCSHCKAYPMKGLRYRCLRCFNYDLCQDCFLTAKQYRKHRDTHPVKEYCSACSFQDDIKTIANIFRNKFTDKKLKVAYRSVDNNVQRRRGNDLFNARAGELDLNTAVSPLDYSYEEEIEKVNSENPQTRQLENIICKLELENRKLRTELLDFKKQDVIKSEPLSETIDLPETPSLTPDTSPLSSITYQLPSDMYDVTQDEFEDEVDFPPAMTPAGQPRSLALRPMQRHRFASTPLIVCDPVDRRSPELSEIHCSDYTPPSGEEFSDDDSKPIVNDKESTRRSLFIYEKTLNLTEIFPDSNVDRKSDDQDLIGSFEDDTEENLRKVFNENPSDDLESSV